MKVHPKNIMCAVDFSDFTDEVFAYTKALCKRFHAKLFLTHIVTDMTTLFDFEHNETSRHTEALHGLHIRNAQKSLEDLTQKLSIEYEIVISKGNPADEIRRLALKEKIDMVITSNQGKSGVTRLLIGSVTEKLMKTIHCPLLVLHTRDHDFIPRDEDEMKLKKILVGCDFSHDSKLAFEHGLSLAQEYKAELHMTHVIKPTEHIELKASDYINAIPGDYRHWRGMDYFEVQQKVTKENRDKINKLRSRLERQLYFMVPEELRNRCSPQTAILTGEPYKELIKYAKDQGIDMIVLGIRGHTLWEKLMVGSTTDRVIRSAPCPVLAVRQVDGHSE